MSQNRRKVISKALLNKLEKFMKDRTPLEEVKRSLTEKEIQDLINGSNFMNLSADLRRVIHMIIQDEEDKEFEDYLELYYGNYPKSLNFLNAPKDPLANLDLSDSVMTTVFKVKYNQIERIINSGYNFAYESLIQSRIRGDDLKSFDPVTIQKLLEENPRENLEDYENPVDFEIVRGGYSGAFTVFLENYKDTQRLSRLLLYLDRVYVSDDRKSAMIVKYISRSDSLNISRDRIKAMVAEIYAIDQEMQTFFGIPIKNALIIAFNSMHSRSIMTLQNMNYFVEESTKIVHNISFEITYHTRLLINVTKSFLVPQHDKLSEEEVNDLLQKTGWTRDSLQGISYKDPVVLHYGFKIGDIIRITRLSNINTQLLQYSYAYREVRNIPMYYSSDKTKSERIMADMKV